MIGGAWLARRPDPAEGLFREATALRATGETAAADALLRRIVSDHGRSAYAAAARELLAPAPVPPAEASAETEPLSPDELRRLTVAYRAIADSNAGTPRGAAALFDLAVVHDNIGDVRAAIETWEEYVRRYPNDDRVPEALYGLGYLYQVSLRDEGRALRYYRRLVQDYPGTRFALEATATLGALGETPPTEAEPSPSPPPATIHTTPGAL